MTVMCSLDTDAAIQLADRGNSLVAHSVGDSIRTTNDSAAHNQMIKFEYVYSHRGPLNKYVWVLRSELNRLNKILNNLNNSRDFNELSKI